MFKRHGGIVRSADRERGAAGDRPEAKGQIRARAEENSQLRFKKRDGGQQRPKIDPREASRLCPF